MLRMAAGHNLGVRRRYNFCKEPNKDHLSAVKGGRGICVYGLGNFRCPKVDCKMGKRDENQGRCVIFEGHF